MGLRYIDVIQRSPLGLAGVPWKELLSPLLVGELASPDIGDDIEHVAREVVFRLNDARDSRVRMRHGVARLEGVDELCYLIDSDLFTDQQTEWRDADRSLDEYNLTNTTGTRGGSSAGVSLTAFTQQWNLSGLSPTVPRRGTLEGTRRRRRGGQARNRHDRQAGSFRDDGECR